MPGQLNDMEEVDVKLAKLNDLKELIYDFLADGYSDKEIMEEVNEAIQGEPSTLAEEKSEDLGDMGQESEDPLQKMKRDYFKPKPAAPRSGTGVFIAGMSQKQAPKREESSKPGKMGKMK